MASELRERFENHMILRDLAANTRKAYIRHTKELTRFYMRSPDTLTNDEIQKYLLHLIVRKKQAWNTVNQAFSAYRLFYAGMLRRDKTEFHIPPRPKMKQLPTVPAVEEVVEIIDSTRNLKHRALLMTTYTAGLRVNEVTSLRPEHIENKRMLIRVDQGKGKKDRYTLLSAKTLETLRDYYRAYKPGEWLFFGKDRGKPMPIGTAQRIFYNAKKRSGVTRGKGIHTLRHCFATHLIDAGVDVYTVKRMMGARRPFDNRKIRPCNQRENIENRHSLRPAFRVLIGTKGFGISENSEFPECNPQKCRKQGADVRYFRNLQKRFCRKNGYVPRFLLRVLPERFVKIRYFGFLSHRVKKESVERIRSLADPDFVPPTQWETAEETMTQLTGVDVFLCPKYRKGRMTKILELPKPKIMPRRV